MKEHMFYYGHGKDESAREHRLIFKGPPMMDSPVPEERREYPLGADTSNIHPKDRNRPYYVEKPKEIKINKKLWDESFDDIQKSIHEFMVDGELQMDQLQLLTEKILATMRIISPEFEIEKDLKKSPEALLRIAYEKHFIDQQTYNDYRDKMKYTADQKSLQKNRNEKQLVLSPDEQFLRLSEEEMHALIQKAKTDGQRFQRQARKNRSQSGTMAFQNYWHLRSLFQKAHGYDYAMYLRGQKGTVPDFSSVQNVQSIPGTNLMKGTLPDGRSISFNPRTGSSMISEGRSEATNQRESASGSSVSDDDFREAKRAIDRGPMGGGRHQLPRDRIASDGSVNFFTEGDRQEVQDFINARASRRLARLEQMESFAAQRADIMDVLTNPDRFEREFQKIKEAPIDYSAPGVMERARKNNVVHYLLSEDHTMVHDVANEPPTRAEIEALRRDAIFRDSWNKVDRRSENMMNFDQFITFRQTGWEDRDTEKFIPSMTKDGFVKDYAYIFHKNSRQELVINPKGEIVAHRWQKPLSDGKIMIAETRFGRPKGSPLKVSRVDFQKTWKNGVPGKLALRDHDGKSLPENFTIDLSKFPRDGRGMMIGNVAWIERDGNSAFKILFMKEGNYDLHALEATSKQRKHALVAVTKGSEKQQTA